MPREIKAARQFRHYAEEARRWQVDRGGLLASDSLRFALAWWDNQRPADAWIARYVKQPSVLRDFLADSRAEDQRVQARKLRGRRARIALFAVVCVSAVAALVAAVFAIHSRAEARRQEREAKRFLAESCLLNGGTAARFEQDPAKALAWYGQAYLAAEKGSDRVESARRLMASWSGALGRPLLHDGPVMAVSFSPDGRTLVSASGDLVRIWDIPSPAADPDDPPERLWLSIQYHTTLTIEHGVVRQLKQAEWLDCWRRLEQLGGPNDVRSWEQVSSRERALLKRP